MQPNLEHLVDLIEQANCPADIFGSLAGDQAATLRRSYRRLAAALHPDANPGRAVAAAEAFRQLQEWYAAAQRDLRAGVYGDVPRFRLTSTRCRYVCYGAVHTGEYCDLFPSTDTDGALLLKVAREPQFNPLLEAEAQAIGRIDRELNGQALRAHFPVLVERFPAADQHGRRRQVQVLRREEGTLSLADLLQRAPQGLHPADAAWIFNRLLAALGVAHSLGIVHGAVLPQHVLIRPADHNAVLIDWSASGSSGTPIRVISSTWIGFYPPEAAAGRPLGPASDLYMAARCMALLLGGSGQAPEPPPSTPAPLRRLLAACLIAAPHRRAGDAWQVLDDHHEVLRRLYGPPSFRPFPVRM
jgi:hypothetical protein